MKVLVLGATGFIGLPVARALVRAGHEVIGSSRHEESRTALEQDEITPLIVDPGKDDSWTSLVPSLDAIIDTLGGSTPIQTLAMANVKAAERAASKRHASASKLTYIWTSGTWIQGDDKFTAKSDGAAITNPAELTKWRPVVESALTSSSTLNGIVIRPSLVYGRSGSISALLFEQARKGSIEWPGDKTSRFATIHTDDLAECYRLAVEKAPLVSGLVLDCSNPATESVSQLLTHLSEMLKIAPEAVRFKQPEGLFEQAVATTSVLRPTLARSLLGWQPLKPSLIDGLPQYYRAFLAHSQAKL